MRPLWADAEKHGNRAEAQYLYCIKRAYNMSCEGCRTLRTAEFEQFVYEAMVHKLSELQTELLSFGEKCSSLPVGHLRRLRAEVATAAERQANGVPQL